MNAQKHEIVCTCVLSQQHLLKNPVCYSFIVFSIIDDNGNIVEKNVQCPNCRTVHRVYEFCKSEIINSETCILINEDDLKHFLPDKVFNILEDYKCELYIYEEAKFILDNKLWKRSIVLTTEYVKTDREIYAEGKKLVFNSFDNYSIEYWHSSF